MDFVPEARTLLGRLDFARAVPVVRSFVDPRPRALETDVVWKVPAERKHECFIYVVIEHQSTTEHLMALRVLKYVTALYDSLVDEAYASTKRYGPDTHLPLIVPIVIYCGEDEWTAPLTFEELLGACPPGVTAPIRLRYYLVNARDLAPDRLRRVKNALAGLFILEKARLEGDTTCPRAFMEALAGETDPSLVEAVLIAAYTISSARGGPVTPRKIWRLLHTQRPRERTMALTMREFLLMCGREASKEAGLKEGLQRGLQKGLQKGLQEGRKEGEHASTARARASLEAWLRRHGVDSRVYADDLARIPDLSRIMDLMAKLAAADDPAAYLRRRFRH